MGHQQAAMQIAPINNPNNLTRNPATIK